jgi:hypothetical protein
METHEEADQQSPAVMSCGKQRRKGRVMEETDGYRPD